MTQSRRAQTTKIIAATVCAALLAVTACAPGSNPTTATTPQAARIVSVRGASASVGTIGVSTTFPASVEAQETVNINPLASGLIQRLNVDVGAEVKKGDVLAELSHGTLDVQLTSAKTLLDQLLNPSPADLQAAVTGVATASAAVNTATSALETLLNPAATDVAAAQSVVATANANLVAAEVKLGQLKRPLDVDVVSSQAALATARAAYVLAQTNFDTAILSQLTARAVDNETQTLTNAVFLLHKNLETHEQQLGRLPEYLGDVPAAKETAAAYQRLIATQPATIAPYPSAIIYYWLSEGSAKASLDSASAKLNALLTPDASSITSAKASLDSSQAAYDSAVAKLKVLQAPEARTLALSKNSLASAQANLDLANAKLTALRNPAAGTMAQAKASVDILQIQLDQTRVMAPFDGTISQRLLNTGALASSQTPLYTMISKAIVISFSVDEANVNAVRPGLTALVSSPAVPGQPQSLSVTRVSPTANAQVHTFSAQIVTDTEKTKLKPGMSARVSITDTHDKAILVPKEAVVSLPTGLVIYKVVADTVKATSVSLGLTDDKFSEVLLGVTAGDVVVVSPQNTLREGDRVTVAAAPAGEAKPKP